MKKKLVLVSLCLLAARFALPAPSLPPVRGSYSKKVLILHSYNQGYAWTDDIHRALIDTFAKHDDIEYYVEYMDANRYIDDWYLTQLVALYGSKYTSRGVRFDVVVASDDNAFNFMEKYGESLFPAVPLVFCGVNYFEPDRLKPGAAITGVNEKKSFRETIELALALNPTARTVAVVSGSRLSERRDLETLLAVMPELADRVELLVLAELPAAELVSRLQSLPEDAVVLLLSYMNAPDGSIYAWQESIKLVTAASRQPVFVCNDFHVYGGVVGGVVVHGYSQGETAGRLALQILDGQSAAALPVVMDSPNKTVIDDTASWRFGIDSALYPAGAILLNMHVDNFIDHWHSKGVKSFFGYDLFEHHGTNMLLVDPDSGIIVDANRAALNFYGHAYLIGRRISEINTLSPEEINVEMENARKQRKNHFNFRHRLANGDIRDVTVYTWPVTLNNSALLFSIIFDVTDRVRAEAMASRQSNLIQLSIIFLLVGASLAIAVLVFQKNKLQAARASLAGELSLKTALLDAIPNPVFFRTTGGIYTGCNKAFEEFTGQSQAEIVGKSISEVCPPEQAASYIEQDLSLIKNPAQAQVFELKVPNAGGEQRDVLFSKAAIRNNLGVVSGLVGVVTDITARKQYETRLQQNLVEKQTLIKELYHRTKNNMQVISSLITLQAAHHDSPELLGVLRDIDQRIKTMALVHQMLYNTSDLSRINLRDYVTDLFGATAKSYTNGESDIKTTVCCEEIFLLIDLVIPCGLVLNEMLVNSYKYAFPTGVGGSISLDIRRDQDGHIQMVYEDDGTGLPAGLDLNNSNTLGLSMIKALVEHQLEGSVTMHSGRGLRYVIRFPDDAYEVRVHV